MFDSFIFMKHFIVVTAVMVHAVSIQTLGELSATN